MDKICRNCKWYRPGIGKGSYGECMYAPPVLTTYLENPEERGPVFEYPKVCGTDFCAFWESIRVGSSDELSVGDLVNHWVPKGTVLSQIATIMNVNKNNPDDKEYVLNWILGRLEAFAKEINDG